MVGYYWILPRCAWKTGPSSAEDDFPLSLWIELGNTTDPSKADFAKLFSADAEGFEGSASSSSADNNGDNDDSASNDDDD